MADLTVVRTRSLDRVRVRPGAADAGRGRRRADVRRLRRFTGRPGCVHPEGARRRTGPARTSAAELRARTVHRSSVGERPRATQIRQQTREARPLKDIIAPDRIRRHNAMRKQEQDARNRACEGAEQHQPAADSVQPDLVGHACRLRAGRRAGQAPTSGRVASDNGNDGNPHAARSGASPTARSAPDSLTFSSPPRSNPAPRSAPTFARRRPDMQPGERKSAAECMFMHRLQTTNMVHLRTAARAPDARFAERPAPGSGARGSRRTRGRQVDRLVPDAPGRTCAGRSGRMNRPVGLRRTCGFLHTPFGRRRLKETVQEKPQGQQNEQKRAEHDAQDQPAEEQGQQRNHDLSNQFHWPHPNLARRPVRRPGLRSPRFARTRGRQVDRLVPDAPGRFSAVSSGRRRAQATTTPEAPRPAAETAARSRRRSPLRRR